MRPSLLHRLVACLVVLSLTLFSVEAAIADVHDGHGSGPALTGQGDGAHLAYGPAEHSTHHRDSSGDSGQPVHVCHCTHGHSAGSVAAGGTLLLVRVPRREAHIAFNQYAPSRAQEPLVRPPIA